MTDKPQRKVRIYFRNPGSQPMLVPVDDDYEITFREGWLVLPQARAAESEILTVQIVNETRELKAA